MLLSEKAGYNKSPFIKTAFLRIFCNKYDIPFGSEIVKVTPYNSAVAAQFKIPSATTIHRAARLNSKSPKRQSNYWVHTIIAFIDEMSFMSTPTCEKLDRRRMIQTGKTDELFEGIHITFAGYFF